MSQLFAHRCQMRRRIPGERQHLVDLKSQHPRPLGTTLPGLCIGVEEDLVPAVHPKLHVSGRGKEGDDTLLCGPGIPNLAYGRLDHDFPLNNSSWILCLHSFPFSPKPYRG